MVRGVLPLSPDRSSLRMSDRSGGGNFRQSNVQSFAGRSQASNVARVPFEQQQRGMQQLSRGNFSVPNRGMTSPSGSGPAPATEHGWGRFGQPIHGSSGGWNGGSNTGSNAGSSGNGRAPQTQMFNRSMGASPSGAGSNGWGRVENARPNTPANNFTPGQRSFVGGSGDAVRISPPMVRERAPSYQAPRNASPSFQAPRSASPAFQAPRSAPSGGSGGGRSSAPSFSGGGGGGNRSGGGGGGARSSGGGGGGHGSHR